MAESKSIFITKEAYCYLNNISRQQRGFEPLNQEAQDKMWARSAHTNNMKLIMNDSLGGGIGSQDYKTWTSWDIDTIKEMLTSNDYNWVEGPQITYMNI